MKKLISILTINNFWWVPVIVILLSGLGFVIKEYYFGEGTIFGIVTPANRNFRITIDGCSLTYPIDINSGFFRIEGCKPGLHSIRFYYENVFDSSIFVKLHGFEQKKIDITWNPISSFASKEDTTIRNDSLSGHSISMETSSTIVSNKSTLNSKVILNVDSSSVIIKPKTMPPLINFINKDTIPHHMRRINIPTYNGLSNR